MVSVEEAVVARLKVSGTEFEILVDPYKALELKRGKRIDVQDILAYPSIYRDVRKALKASEEELQKCFGTTDVWKIAERIIREGNLQLTVEQRRRLIEEKKMQIATIISRRSVDPKTNLPHPPQRILNVMKQAGVNVDPFEDAELQVDRVIKSIKTLIPIKMQRVTIEVTIPVESVVNVLLTFLLDERKLIITLDIGSLSKSLTLTVTSIAVLSSVPTETAIGYLLAKRFVFVSEMIVFPNDPIVTAYFAVISLEVPPLN